MSLRVDYLFERMKGSENLKTVCSDDGRRTWLLMSSGPIIPSHTPLIPLDNLLQFIWMYYEGVMRVDSIKVRHNMRHLTDRSTVPVRCSHMRIGRRVFDTYAENQEQRRRHLVHAVLQTVQVRVNATDALALLLVLLLALLLLCAIGLLQ